MNYYDPTLSNISWFESDKHDDSFIYLSLTRSGIDLFNGSRHNILFFVKFKNVKCLTKDENVGKELDERNSRV